MLPAYVRELDGFQYIQTMQLTRLGPYEINRPLGKGGMGSVYAATDSQTGQRVAIKALSPHLAMAEGFRERFEAEIESLRTLRHEGIVRLYGYGEENGVVFYSMELVEGISLEDELKAGRRFNWREVTNYAIQLSLALKHAHDHGIIHRDIKPANILLCNDDRVKLADFGIARLFGTTSLTTAGGVLGTADYMSPEQAEGRPVTARCDQYSLGGVMYALLAGRPPFLAKNLPQMLQLQRFAQPEPVRRFAPDTPEQLERVIAQLLAKDPADRFPNTQVLARHLQAMVIALSRPAADDFALSGDPLIDSDLGADQSIEITQVDETSRLPSLPSLASRVATAEAATQNAATLAAEDAGDGGQPSAAAVASITLQPAEPRTRFVTVEDEEALARAEARRSWILIAAQLVCLIAILGGIVWFLYYISQPATADDLYAAVAERGDGENDAPLGAKEREIDAFLRLYPDDRRATEMRRYKQRVELDKRERKLRREARDGGIADPSLLPVERLYLRAANLVESSPEAAVVTFQSLIDLYGPTAAEAQDEDVAAIVQLARERLTSLQDDLANMQERQRATLAERMHVAETLSETEPQQAAAMYRAIVELHQNDKWASDVVAEARSRLETLDVAKQ